MNKNGVPFFIRMLHNSIALAQPSSNSRIASSSIVRVINVKVVSVLQPQQQTRLSQLLQIVHVRTAHGQTLLKSTT